MSVVIVERSDSVREFMKVVVQDNFPGHFVQCYSSPKDVAASDKEPDNVHLISDEVLDTVLVMQHKKSMLIEKPFRAEDLIDAINKVIKK